MAARPERLYSLAFTTNAFPSVKNLTPSSSCTSFYRFAIFARFANDSCGFLQRKVPYRGTIFHIRKPALHQRSALRNFDFAYTAPRYKQLPQWPKPPPHGTLRMTIFVCFAVPLLGREHPTNQRQALLAGGKLWQKMRSSVSPAARHPSSTPVSRACMKAASAAARARSTVCCTAWPAC